MRRNTRRYGIKGKNRRRGFTLIEIVVVMVLLSLMALVAAPRGFFSLESPARQLQQCVIELSDLALDGLSVRMRFDPVGRSDFGSIVVEGLVKVEDRFFPERYTLEWKPIALRHSPTGDRWRLEPELVYFYTDGTCTPARILNAPRGARLREADSFFLTVTAFLFEEEKGQK